MGRGINNLPGAVQGRFSGAFSGGTTDSLQHRDKYEDSITIYYQLPFSLQKNKLDSSIIDFNRRFPIPAEHAFLGNTGTATHSILFDPYMRSGWDHGMHALDVYHWNLESIRFFNTTRPYTELAYMLGGRAEQMAEITHTQNVKPNLNVLLQYRFINAPGFFKNQKTNDNNYLVSSWYQSINKRYNNYFVMLANTLQSDENGGLRNDHDYLNDPIYNDRFNIPTKIGGDAQFGTNFFSSTLHTGNRYADFNLMLRQQYDLGKKDSIVGDSVIIPLFYPRLRFEHVFRYSTYKLKFMDTPNPDIGYFPSPLYYDTAYNFTLVDSTLTLEDQWKEINNEFSIYTFPDAKNQLQFLKLGAVVQNLKAVTSYFRGSFYNILAQGEYRNTTRDKKWDVSIAGKLYFAGLNSGDYDALLNLKRIVSKKGDFIDLSFKNVNRTPSFSFDHRSSFYFDTPKDLNKENITLINGSFYLAKPALEISGNYFLAANYTYYTDYYKVQQENALFNVLQVSLGKVFRVGRRWLWHADVYFQQKTGNVDLNLPTFVTRNRFGYEGTLGFKKLNIATGFEVKYHSPYNADGYSPATGKFFFQDSVRINNRPDIAAYIHFRIRNFRAFIRAENLNTMTFENGFGFRHNNFASPDYPYPGFNMRLSIYWTFLN